jgi:hypothetical protein
MYWCNLPCTANSFGQIEPARRSKFNAGTTEVLGTMYGNDGDVDTNNYMDANMNMVVLMKSKKKICLKNEGHMDTNNINANINPMGGPAGTAAGTATTLGGREPGITNSDQLSPSKKTGTEKTAVGSGLLLGATIGGKGDDDKEIDIPELTEQSRREFLKALEQRKTQLRNQNILKQALTLDEAVTEIYVNAKGAPGRYERQHIQKKLLGGNNFGML